MRYGTFMLLGRMLLARNIILTTVRYTYSGRYKEQCNVVEVQSRYEEIIIYHSVKKPGRNKRNKLK